MLCGIFILEGIRAKAQLICYLLNFCFLYHCFLLFHTSKIAIFSVIRAICYRNSHQVCRVRPVSHLFGLAIRHTYIASVLLTLQLVDATFQGMNLVEVINLTTIVISRFRRLGNFFFFVITQQLVKQKHLPEKTQK